ncbi:MAG: nicotinate-nucleotide adenylyltransferase [Chitinispirillaceae bacterium]|nr:nicotinate-nucleotide adenylyltransferase [Chitinispirillaceae bacterium]
MSRKHRRFSPVSALATDAPAPIGVLGGVFDPPHNGHLAIAALAMEFFGLCAVLFVPSGTPPHKSRVTASASERLAMLSAAIRGEPGFSIYDRETLHRGVSYTVDTLRELIRLFPGRHIFFIIGSDNLDEIKTWRKYREILSMVTLCVAHRPGYAIRVPASIRSARIAVFPSPEWGVSSTLVREYFSQGLSCRHLVPAKVAAYVAQKKLYTAQGTQRDDP